VRDRVARVCGFLQGRELELAVGDGEVVPVALLAQVLEDTDSACPPCGAGVVLLRRRRVRDGVDVGRVDGDHPALEPPLGVLALDEVLGAT
jgi:hypothetical protein